MRINLVGILNILGVLLFINAGLMLLCIPFALYYSDGTLTQWLASSGASVGVGAALWLSTTRKGKRPNIRKRDGYVIVTMSWVVMALSGSLPYIISGTIPEFTDAFFESISGFTTTGASIIAEPEHIPPSILFWRSLTQWVGGLGFIVLVISVLPYLGIGGMQLFLAEMPGVTTTKLQPRIQDTAIRLWLLYIGLTIAQTLLLRFGGMHFFDAINHSLTTMATGGFSTHSDSIAHFNSPFIEYVTTAFMFLGGTSFVLLYGFFKGRFLALWRNEEFRTYLLIIFVAAFITTVSLTIHSGQPMEDAFRTSLFQTVSILTTTGFIAADYTAWGSGLVLLFFLLMFIGGCAGSTSGGVKVIRHVIIARNTISEFKRQLHPSAIIPVRFNDKAVDIAVTRNIMAFIIIYITIFGAASVALALLGMDVYTAIGSVASALGNVGPGLHHTGPVETYAHLGDLTKWILGALMVVGRLELFTVLILFTGYFWRSV